MARAAIPRYASGGILLLQGELSRERETGVRVVRRDRVGKLLSLAGLCAGLYVLSRLVWATVYVVTLPPAPASSPAAAAALAVWELHDPATDLRLTADGKRTLERARYLNLRLVDTVVVSEQVFPGSVLVTVRRSGFLGLPVITELYFTGGDGLELALVYDLDPLVHRRRQRHWATSECLDQGWAQFYYRPGEFALEEVHLFAASQQAYYRRASDLLQLQARRPFRYYLYHSPYDIGALGYLLSFGVALPGRDEIHVVPRQYTGPHEETHILSYQLGRPPGVFEEGLAVYVESAVGLLDVPRLPLIDLPAAWDPVRSQGVIWDLETRHRQALGYVESGSILSRLVHRRRPPPAAYALGGSFIAYLAQTHGPLPLQRFYSLAGTGVEEAARAAYARSFSALESEWLSWLRATYTSFR
jgi:hypothetical protein